MHIHIRMAGGNFAEVKIITNETTIDLGFLDKEERLELARKFEEAVDDLLSN